MACGHFALQAPLTLAKAQALAPIGIHLVVLQDPKALRIGSNCMKIEQELDGLFLSPHHGQIVDCLISKHLFYSVSIRTWLFTTDIVVISKRTVLFKNQPSAFPGERWAGCACLPAPCLGLCKRWAPRALEHSQVLAGSKQPSWVIHCCWRLMRESAFCRYN